MEQTMKKVVGKTFSKEEVPLDDHRYKDCTFESCTFIFEASGGFFMDKNHISTNCVFKFTGPASKTVAAMKAIYSMGDWGRTMVLNTFKEIAPDLKKLH